MTNYRTGVILISAITLLFCGENLFANCTNVPASMLDMLEGELSVENSTLEKKSAQMIEAKKYQNIYFIAARVNSKATKPKNNIAVWSANSLDAATSMVLSINPVALKVSAWPNAKKSSLRLTKKNRSVKKVISCVEKYTP